MPSDASLESERLAGAREKKSDVRADKESTCRNIGDAIVLVDVVPDNVNDTPDPLGGYIVQEIDGRSPSSLGDEPLRCLSCGYLFSGAKAWSELFSHQGSPCEPPREPEIPHAVKVQFPCTRAPDLVKQVLAEWGLQIQYESFEHNVSPNHWCSFIVDVSILQRRLRELAFAEATCYNLERWYDELRAYTAETFMFPLEAEDLDIFPKLHAAWHLGSHSVDNAILQRHHELERRVQEAVWGDRQDTFFVKTSMRSPKDAAQVEHAPDTPAHVRLRHEIGACCVSDAPSAIALLIRSKRIMTDTANFKKYACKTRNSVFNLIFRRWDPLVVESIEWRCFVSDGRLTAISQYHCYTALADIVEATEERLVSSLKGVRARLTAFQKAIHAIVVKCVGVNSYVLDLATNLDGGVDADVRLIEINPFITSGAALFSWRRDHDLLTAGRRDEIVELRVARSFAE